MELFLFGCLDHAVEIGSAAINAGEVFVTVDGVNIPAVVDGVVGQQGLLVLDALGLGLVLVLILLTQSCIDRAEDLLHPLKGITAHCYDTAGTVGPKRLI